MPPVDTRTVANRRVVQLATLEALEAEADRILAAAREKRVKTLGNWTTAQVLEHVGKMIHFSIDGFFFRYPLWIRLASKVGRLVNWRRFVAHAFQPGFKNPPIAIPLEPSAVVDLERAGRYLHRHLDRLRAGEQMTQESPAEGPLTHEQWVYVHLRHAELHFSFLQIEDKPEDKP